MRIPASFKAANKRWKIKRMGKRRSKKLDGLCEYTTHTISLADRPKREDMEHTFIHECIHVLEHALGLKIDHDQLDAAAGLIHQMIHTAEGEYDGEL